MMWQAEPRLRLPSPIRPNPTQSNRTVSRGEHRRPACTVRRLAGRDGPTPPNRLSRPHRVSRMPLLSFVRLVPSVPIQPNPTQSNQPHPLNPPNPPPQPRPPRTNPIRPNPTQSNQSNTPKSPTARQTSPKTSGIACCAGLYRTGRYGNAFLSQTFFTHAQKRRSCAIRTRFSGLTYRLAVPFCHSLNCP